MQYEYKTFIEILQQKLLTKTGFSQEQIYFKKENEMPETKGDRLVLKIPRTNVGYEVCALYIKELFDEYRNGWDIEEILEQITVKLESVEKSECFVKVQNIENFEMIKRDLFVRLINYDRNKKTLEGAIYRTVGDVALVVYANLGEMDGCITSVKIKKYMTDKWDNMSLDQIFEYALLNTYYVSPPRIYSWEKLMLSPDYEGDDFMDSLHDYPVQKGEMGNCLSTTLRSNGAVAVFLPGVAQRISQLLNSGFYLVFTSVHEVMIHSDQCVDPFNLRQVLKETVEEATPAEDFLTFNIYHYDPLNGSFTFAD